MEPQPDRLEPALVHVTDVYGQYITQRQRGTSSTTYLGVPAHPTRPVEPGQPSAARRHRDELAAATCRGCPVRDQCTRSTSTSIERRLTVPPREAHHAQLTARAAQDTPDWQADYARRAGVEGTIRQAVAVTGTRRARYRGLPETRLEHVYSAVALNLIRQHAYWNGHALDRTRTQWPCVRARHKRSTCANAADVHSNGPPEGL